MGAHALTTPIFLGCLPLQASTRMQPLPPFCIAKGQAMPMPPFACHQEPPMPMPTHTLDHPLAYKGTLAQPILPLAPHHPTHSPPNHPCLFSCLLACSLALYEQGKESSSPEPHGVAAGAAACVEPRPRPPAASPPPPLHCPTTTLGEHNADPTH